MAEGELQFYSPRQFNAAPRRHPPMPQAQHVGAAASRRLPPRPLRVAPIQSRSPSPERAVILPPPMPHVTPVSPVPDVTPVSPVPHVTPVTPVESPTHSHDLASGLRRDRQAYYVKAASAARASVRMDTPKPSLRPPIQPPGLFYLMACGLLTFDLECGEFQAFQAEVDKWQTDPLFMLRFFAAYGRFYSPSHHVQPYA